MYYVLIVLECEVKFLKVKLSFKLKISYKNVNNFFNAFLNPVYCQTFMSKSDLRSLHGISGTVTLELSRSSRRNPFIRATSFGPGCEKT